MHSFYMGRVALASTLIVFFLLAAPISATAQSSDADIERKVPQRASQAGDVDDALADDSLIDVEYLSNEEILRLMSGIYRSQAEILAAHAREDSVAVERMLDEAVEDLLRLSRGAGVDTLDRYRELFRSVVSEYEAVYGAVDSLSPALGGIFGFRARMFASMNELSEPLLEDVDAMPELGPISTEVPMTMNRLVESSVLYLLREPDRHIHGWLSRADTYLPMIEEIFAEEGVPDELKYLAMIESGLNPRARSWARAVGMWQFISATGRHYGLEVDNWVDERMDPEKSTRAAARHLKDLYKMFGDWHLALAGYNYSPGKLRRHLRRVERGLNRKATFWDVYRYIPRETRNYVPMFIATSLMVSQPEAFGLQKGEPGPSYEYHHVPVYGMLSLTRIAEMAGTDRTTIRALNPELRRSTLPPSRTPYWVRIPMGTYEAFAEAYRELPESYRRPLDEHVVKQGETLSVIASKYGVSWRQLMNSNGLKSSRIRVGQRLAVPLRDYGMPDEGEDLMAAGGLTVRYGVRMVRPIAGPAMTDIPSTAAKLVQRSEASKNVNAPSRKADNADEDRPGTTRIVYTVRRGDTLGEIAEKYGVTASQLRRWNSIRGSRINVGQKLKLFVDAKESTSSTYTVQRGDNLASIAAKHGLTVASLREWNGIRGSVIHPGQKLVVSKEAAEAAGKTVSYKVRRGDTLGKIARRHGVTVSQLRRWNNLSGTKIVVGQRLKILS
ncbi:MAG: LysM peptidoglycan-binding domain-containing protein [Rhodothermia bacterium]|nr:LysM peptidoglycan-binding domain-containing protein [Rhodothermia bacterium]